MRNARFVLVAVAVAATWLTFSTDTYAQRGPAAIRGGAVPFGAGRLGPGQLGRGQLGAGRLGFGRGVGRGLQGFNTLYYANTGHEFARTIPRVFGDSVLPYYALYPPVYYSQPVPRPYGFSPFALPPGVQPAEGIPVPAEPEVTINPYFQPANPDENEAAPSSQQTVSTPRLIENPYFVKQLTPEQAKMLAGTSSPELSAVGLR